MNPGNLHKKFWVLVGVIFTLMLFLMAQPVVAQASYSSEQDFINRSDRSKWIIDPAPKLLVDRQDIANNVAVFKMLGMDINENFAWYSNETTITVQAGDTRQFAYRAAGGIGWVSLYPFFDAGVELHVFEYAGTFITRACSNFSPNILIPPSPKISGHKWGDRNEDGTHQTDELPLANWTIILYKDGKEVARTVTDIYGYYEFILDARPKPLGLGVTPGTFTLGEVLKTGWKNTLKPGPVNVLPGVPGKNYSDNDFLNFKPGYISGHKWYDINRNGTWEKGVEPPLANWEITLKDSNGNLVTTDAFGNLLPNPVKTNTSGYYKFSKLSYGTYTVHEILQNGWYQIWPPSGYYTVKIQSQSARTGRNFGNWTFLPPKITGHKWNDLNQNSFWDSGEPPLSGWEIILYKGGVEFGREVTDANGYYEFTLGLDFPDTYTLEEVLKDGWLNTKKPNPITILPTDEGKVFSDNDFGNFKPGRIDGHKWNDLDKDGNWGAQESGLADWEITLKDTNGNLVTTDAFGNPMPNPVLTDAKGYYEFKNLAYGTYTVTETLKTGWEQSYPPAPGTYIINVISGTDSKNNNFGNFKLARISGYKWNDLNKNGIWDSSEPPLKDWTIILKKDGVEVARTTTDANGHYEFTGLTQGNYTLEEVLQDGWVNTKAPDPLYVAPGETYENRNFGNFKLGKISGYKWDDTDEDGIWDSGEPALGGWVINLSGPKSDSDTTDASGYYEFTNLHYGTYTVTEVLKDGWVGTYPASGSHIIPVVSRTDSKNNNFGNFKLGKISGYKWDDKDKDGVWDSDEPPLEGWTINLTGPTSASDITDASGYYEFTGLHAGIYTISEVLKPGWEQSYPAGGTHTIAIVSGTEATDKDFGNCLIPKPGWIWGRIFFRKTCSGTIVGIPDVEIKLLPMGDFPGMVTRTDANGYYRFDKLIPNNTPQRPEPAYLVTDGLETKEAVVYEGKGTQIDFLTKRYAAFIDPWSGTKMIIDYIGKNFRFYVPDYGWYSWKHDAGMQIVADLASIKYADSEISISGVAIAKRDYAYFTFADLLRNKKYVLYDPFEI